MNESDPLLVVARLETPEQVEKFQRLGGEVWLRKTMEQAINLFKPPAGQAYWQICRPHSE